ncbi:MAG TPA: O-antigen ligase family protein [Vicinamibacterales bacterium]|nr:O-antigen ligase family protein [Vicinamibacterales bacterium]
MRRITLAAVRIVGLAAALAIFVAWQFSPAPLPLKLLPAAVLALTLYRPSAGLLTMAGLGPVAGGWAIVLASPYGGTHAFEQLVLAVLIGAGLRLWRPPVAVRLAEPALLVAAVAIASGIAVQPALLLHQSPGVTATEHIRILLSGGYFDRGMLAQPLTIAVATAEGLALAIVAERLVRDEPELLPRVVRMVVLGHAGLAAISINRIIGAAIQTEHALPSIVRLLRDVRTSAYADLNAAGSVLAMVLLAGTGLLGGSSRWRWLTAIALVLVGIGLWLAGSRTALVALAAGLLALLAAEAIRRRGPMRWLAGGAVAAAIAIGVFGAARYPAIRNTSPSSALQVRGFLAGIGFEMWQSSPVLGIGIGRFWAESSNYGGADRPFGIVNENAHDNFLQVLAEQGLLGLAALVIVLGTLFVAALRPAVLQSALHRSLAAGTIVFVLTWFGGHPLLLPEAGFAFWLLAGALAGATEAPPSAVWRPLLILVAVVILVTAPLRAGRAVREIHFEDVPVGLSAWQGEVDGVRYRGAGPTFQLYVPSDGTAVTLPMRRGPGSPSPLQMVMRINGQQVSAFEVPGYWQPIFIQLPKTAHRFELVEFAVAGAESRPAFPPLVLVGKMEVKSR